MIMSEKSVIAGIYIYIYISNSTECRRLNVALILIIFQFINLRHYCGRTELLLSHLFAGED